MSNGQPKKEPVVFDEKWIASQLAATANTLALVNPNASYAHCIAIAADRLHEVVRISQAIAEARAFESDSPEKKQQALNRYQNYSRGRADRLQLAKDKRDIGQNPQLPPTQ